MRSIRRLGAETHNPLEGVANLFDVGIVFALGFLLALITYLGLPEVIRRTAVEASATPQAEVVDPDGVTLQRYRISDETLGGDGVKLGVAYRLASGEVVCVPEEHE